MNIETILLSRFPDAEWSLVGGDYRGLTWLSDSPKPTEAELEALWPEVQAEAARERVEQARAQAYRETSDALFFQYQRGDKTEQEWLDAVQAVKDAHPYPEDVTTDETQ
jgi:hypothetical protein